MGESILNSTKKLLGITDEDKSFDVDVIMHINSTFLDLSQLGVGPSAGFMIEDDTVEWPAFLGADLNLNAAKTYMYYKVRLAFDPPANGPAVSAMERQVERLEWRLNVHRESTQWVSPVPVVLPGDDIFADEIILDGNSG